MEGFAQVATVASADPTRHYDGGSGRVRVHLTGEATVRVEP